MFIHITLLVPLLSSSISFLKLNRFLPGSKAWKIFASKLQRKLLKLNTTKQPIRKPYSKPAKKKKISWPRLCVQSHKFKHKKKLPKTLLYHHHHSQRNPSSPAVYVDQLFINPVSVIKDDDANPSSLTVSAVAKKVIVPSSSSANKDEEDTGVSADQDSADYMWESMVLASPQLNQINERADEFIAKFRADMRLQERLARRL